MHTGALSCAWTLDAAHPNGVGTHVLAMVDAINATLPGLHSRDSHVEHASRAPTPVIAIVVWMHTLSFVTKVCTQAALKTMGSQRMHP